MAKELTGQAYAQAPLIGAAEAPAVKRRLRGKQAPPKPAAQKPVKRRLRGKQAEKKEVVKPPPRAPVPRGPAYLMSGESLDTVGDLLYNKQLLKKQRFRSSAMPNVATSTVLGRNASSQLLDQHGLLPTEVTKKRLQGKQAAKPYK